MIEELVEGLVKTTRRIVGDPIQVGNRTLTPTIEVTVYCKQFNFVNNSGPVLAGFIVKPVSIHVTEGKQEWTIEIQK
jgi:hypothetical protein